MSRTSLTAPGRELVIEREVIPVHYMTDIDGRWTSTDAAGHRHHCEYDAADHYPTLVTVYGDAWWCGQCHDEHQDSHLECRQCGEQVTPGMTGPGTKYLPGLLTCTYNGELITEAEAMALAASWEHEAR